MRYTPIIGTLGYIISQDKQKVLLVHRTAKLNDDHLGKYNGLGGKMMPNEDIFTCMQREIYEEAGIECSDIELRGTINWTGFGANQENWLGFIFRINSFKGTPFTSNAEGTLDWAYIHELDQLPMWEGDRQFLPMIFDESSAIFHGFMSYQGEKMMSWSYHR